MLTKVFKFPIALVVLICLCMIGFNLAGIHYPMVLPFYKSVSTVLFGSGVSIILVAGYAFKKANTTVNPATPEAASVLVTNGLFAVSRNPMYIGFLLFISAFWIFSENLMNGLFLPLFILLANRWYIIPEENALEQVFKEPFLAYKSKVKRWL